MKAATEVTSIPAMGVSIVGGNKGEERMTYQQAYGMADTLVKMDNAPRFIVTDTGAAHGSDNYEVVKREQLDGRKPIVRIERDGAKAVLQTRGHHAMTEHTFYVVEAPGAKPQKARLWSDVLELARASGWQASATQYRFTADGSPLEPIELDAHHIEQDFMERAR